MKFVRKPVNMQSLKSYLGPRTRRERVRDPITGRLKRFEPPYEPPSVLLDLARTTAQVTARPILNHPTVAMYVERSVLGWLLEWDPRSGTPVLPFVALRAANAVRRLKTMVSSERTRACSRSTDLPRLVSRARNAT